MKLEQAQEWVDVFLSDHPVRRSRSVRGVGSLELWNYAAEAGGAPAPVAIRFSPFIIEHAILARELSRQLMIAGRDGDLNAVRSLADDMLAEHDATLVKFAMKLFVTHGQQAQELRIPALERRAPLKVVPSSTASAKAETGETLLNWWREDPEANEHHDHWHVVYPSTGIADPTDDDPDRTRELNRQGELFFYMHEQMLARYDHERIAVNLPLVQPFSDYGAPIAEGYDPYAGLEGFPETWSSADGVGLPTARPADACLPEELPNASGAPLRRSEMAKRYDELLRAIMQGQMKNEAGNYFDMGIDDLGHATEPSLAPDGIADRSRVPHRDTYSFHGLGHRFIGLTQGTDKPAGVMYDTDTAIRDPAFYRWHRHVDDLAFAWQERQLPHDLSKDSGAVTMRRSDQRTPDRPAESMDLILIEEDRHLAALSDDGLRDHLAAKLAGEHWAKNFASASPATEELHTQMFSRPLRLQPAGSDSAEAVTRDLAYLDQHRFAYAVRMQNTQPRDHDVTIRLFFVADELFDQRRMWIELDKFKHRVVGERSIAIRRASESSVIRQPGQKPPGPTRQAPAPESGIWGSKSYCDCGWPYNLLLPRSTRKGQKYWLAATVTDSKTDEVPSGCGSMSYCGAKDRYPDKKPMGYPFDRPITGPGIAQALSEHSHMAARSFRIRWVDGECNP